MKITELFETSFKLGGSSNKEALQHYMDDFLKATEPNPFAGRVRIHNDSIGVELSPWNGYIHLSFITSFMKKNDGQASKTLKWLTDLADKHQVKMNLTVAPVKHAGATEGDNLNKSQLRAWYRRYGFVPSGGDHMVREPKKVEDHA